MNPVGWFEIYVNDLPRATTFYEAVLNQKLSTLDAPSDGLQMMAFPMKRGAPGATGALVKMDGMNARGNGTIVYFVSDDCSLEQSRVEAAGGKVIKPKGSIGPYGFIMLAVDTEGNTFGVHSMK